MVKKEKIDEANSIKELFKNNQGLIFTNHSGLKAEDAVQVRRKLEESNSFIRIIKNTLALIAAEEVYEDLDLSSVLKGPTSVVVNRGDIVDTARILKGLYENLETLKVKGGILKSKLIDGVAIEKIANLPAREVLLTDLVVSIKSPVFRLINVLNSIITNLVMVLYAIKQKKEEE